MNQAKALAIKLAGIKSQFLMSPHEPSNEQKFDRMWPSLQAKFTEIAEQILRGDTSRATVCSSYGARIYSDIEGQAVSAFVRLLLGMGKVANGET